LLIKDVKLYTSHYFKGNILHGMRCATSSEHYVKNITNYQDDKMKNYRSLIILTGNDPSETQCPQGRQE